MATAKPKLLIQIDDEIREMTAAEQTAYEAQQIEATAVIESQATARASALAKLAELGLTEEEIAAL
jgi:hypothetical protein